MGFIVDNKGGVKNITTRVNITAPLILDISEISSKLSDIADKKNEIFLISMYASSLYKYSVDTISGSPSDLSNLIDSMLARILVLE